MVILISKISVIWRLINAIRDRYWLFVFSIISTVISFKYISVADNIHLEFRVVTLVRNRRT